MASKETKPISVETKFAIAAALALITVVALCAAFYWTTLQVQKSQSQVTATYETLISIGSILTRVTEAETAQRGFILTDREEFLAPYYDAIKTINKDIQDLRQGAPDNPAQQKAISRLEELIQQRLDRLREGLDVRRTNGFEAARQIILSRRGSEIMDLLRTQAHQIEAEAGASLRRRYERSRTNSRNILVFFSALAIANFSLLTLTYAVLLRETTQRRNAFETQSRLLKELEVANQELKDFAHVVSHDLKAPLRGISSLAIFLNADYGEKIGTEGREQLGLLQSRVKRLHDLIEAILHYSRMSRLQEEKKMVDLKRLLAETVELLAPPERVKITIGPMPSIVVEPTRIQQVFQNLLSNAIKFMDKPVGLVTVECTEEEKHWRFAVADNGPGIDEKYHHKIFLLFQTLAPRDELESTGVGLSVAKKAVESCGGKIWVESVVGQGTTFFFTIPKTQV